MFTKLLKNIRAWIFLVIFGAAAFAAPPVQHFLFSEENIPVYAVCDTSAAPLVSIISSFDNLKARNPDNTLRILNANERAGLKGCEIAKIGPITRIQSANYDIEIVSMEAIEGGVNVFARAWTREITEVWGYADKEDATTSLLRTIPVNTQIGFGKDGTVDIERFRTFNPPILVDDPLGTIDKTVPDVRAGITVVRMVREDPRAALLEDLAHTISVKAQRFSGENIIAGKIGRTTTTVRPLDGSGTAPIDGVVAQSGTNVTFVTLQTGSGDEHIDDQTELDSAFLGADTTTNRFDKITRGIFGGDFTGIDDGDTLDSGTFSLKPATIIQTGLGDNNVEIVTASPADEANLANGDFAFSNFGTTLLATGIALSAQSVGTFTDYTLNASGLSHINIVTGNSYFGVLLFWDFDGEGTGFDGTWGSNDTTKLRAFHADETGTTSDPKWVIESSVAVTSIISDLRFYE